MGMMKNKWMWVAAVVVVLVVLWAAGVINLPMSSKYQAVFLTNNQVYFGKVSNLGSSFPTLTDIYYLQVTQALQPKTNGTQPQINLVKLGGELHGPEDLMRINKDQILFVEDLKVDSQVVNAIKDYKKNQPAAK